MSREQSDQQQSAAEAAQARIQQLTQQLIAERDAARQAQAQLRGQLEQQQQHIVRLEAQTDQMQWLINASPATTYRCQAEVNYDCTFVTPNIQSVLGYTPDEVIAEPQFWPKRLHPEDAERALADISRLFEQSSLTSEYRFRHRDGHYVWLRDERTVVYDPQDNPSEVVGYFTDISDRKIAEAELRRTNAELERATRLKDEFLANMSHELRTPLNAILGMAEGLQEEICGPVTEHQRRSLSIIEHSSTHLLSLINDILNLSKIEAGQLELDFTPVDVNGLCDSSLTFVKQQAHKKQQQLETQIPPNLPNLYGDERRLCQVLINLLTNAVKFTPAGGRITLSATYTPLPPKDIAHPQDWVHPQGEPAATVGILSLAVADTGIGISPENAQKLFQPFAQVDSALNRQHEGTGLGLALVKRITELHGGQVELTSAVGNGSCFTVRLPVITVPRQNAPATDLTAPIAVTAPLDQASAPLILLAEDNEANIRTITAYLEAKGYSLVVAHNGIEAVNLAKTASPDLILMDIQMPQLDGLEAMRQIRQTPELANIPIVALTALAMPDDRERCLAAGADQYISRPIRMKQLSQVMQTLLAKPSIE